MVAKRQMQRCQRAQRSDDITECDIVLRLARQESKVTIHHYRCWVYWPIRHLPNALGDMVGHIHVQEPFFWIRRDVSV